MGSVHSRMIREVQAAAASSLAMKKTIYHYYPAECKRKQRWNSNRLATGGVAVQVRKEAEK
jgi:hypothetical protein